MKTISALFQLILWFQLKYGLHTHFKKPGNLEHDDTRWHIPARFNRMNGLLGNIDLFRKFSLTDIKLSPFNSYCILHCRIIKMLPQPT